MTQRLPVSQGALTALRELFANEESAVDRLANRELSALLDRMEVIDPERTLEILERLEAVVRTTHDVSGAESGCHEWYCTVCGYLAPEWNSRPMAHVERILEAARSGEVAAALEQERSTP